MLSPSATCVATKGWRWCGQVEVMVVRHDKGWQPYNCSLMPHDELGGKFKCPIGCKRVCCATQGWAAASTCHTGYAWRAAWQRNRQRNMHETSPPWWATTAVSRAAPAGEMSPRAAAPQLHIAAHCRATSAGDTCPPYARNSLLAHLGNRLAVHCSWRVQQV